MILITQMIDDTELAIVSYIYHTNKITKKHLIYWNSNIVHHKWKI